MSRPVLTDLNLSQNQLLAALLHKSSSPPGGAVSGQIYYNTSENRAYVYNGTTWDRISKLASGNLIDVDETNKANGYILKYNSTSQKLEYVDPGTGVSSMTLQGARTDNNSGVWLNNFGSNSLFETPFVLPFNYKLIGISGSNRNLRTFDIDIYKNADIIATPVPANRVARLSFTNASNTAYSGAYSVDLNAGDLLGIHIAAASTDNADRAHITLNLVRR